MGGMIAAIERGYPQREIHDAAYRFQKELESKEKIIVGVNDFVAPEETPIDMLVIDDEAQERQCAKLKRLRAERNDSLVRRGLDQLKRAAEGSENLLPPILDCVRAYATLGEMCDALRAVFGEHREPNFD
jgi:methylmalonyl-CoA mutase N-terminal domain/subunit